MPDLQQNLPSHPLGQCAGLVFGFVFREGRAFRVSDVTLPGVLEPGYDWVWLHLALSDHRARRFLEGFPDCPDVARKLVTSGEERLQLHLSAEGGHGVLPDLQKDFDDEWLGAGRYAFWLDGRHLLTARRHPLRGMEEMQEAIGAGLVPASPADALARFCGHYLEMVETRLVALGAQIDKIEDAVLADRSGLDQLPLGPLRRELSRHTREFGALRSAFSRTARAAIASPLSGYLPPLQQELDDHDRDAGALQDRARLIYEEVNTRISAVTNRSLSALTVISTLLLPPTFVVGAFGMNVEGLPWSHDASGFTIVVLFCFLLIGGSYAVLRKFRILP